MKASETNILKFIGGLDKVFIIPPFQRNYEWTFEQCDELFEDIINSYKTKKTHYLGNIVYYEGKNNGASFSEFILVDGQQRVTTILLLLCAIRDEMKKQNLPDENITFRYLENDNGGDAFRVRLKQTSYDLESFNMVVKGLATTNDKKNNAVEITKSKLNFECDNDVKIDVKLGNACDLKDIENESIDLICTHPPYADIIKYSDGIAGDLSWLKYKDFLVEIEKVASECFRVLKKGKFCAIVIGDTRKNGMVQPLGFEVMQRFINVGFKQKEIIIKEQHNCKATGFWKTNSEKYNFLLLAHEYVFVFKK